MKAWKITLIILTCILIAAGISVGTIYILQKKGDSKKKWPTDYKTGGVEKNADTSNFPHNDTTPFEPTTCCVDNSTTCGSSLEVMAFVRAEASASVPTSMQITSNQIPKYDTVFGTDPVDDPFPYVTKPSPSSGDVGDELVNKVIELKGRLNEGVTTKEPADYLDSNSSNGYTITTSNTNSSDDGYKVFDAWDDTFYQGSSDWSVGGGGEYIGLSNLATDTSGGTTVQGEWIVIDLHTKRKLSGYTLTRKTDSFVGDPKQWKIYGKKSSTANWELIDEKSTTIHINDVTGGGSRFDLDVSSVKYKSFALVVQKIHTVVGQTTSFQLQSFELFVDPRIDVHLPTFGDVGYIGRPHSNIPEFTHWGSTYWPLEIIKLDPMPTEAWDEAPGNAVYNYDGFFRFNLLHLIKKKDDILSIYGSLNYSAAVGAVDTIHDRLNTDFYYAHTQPKNMNNMSCTGPGGVYHYHGFKAGEVLNYANRVIGYSVDGFAIMGQGTYIFKPTIQNGRVIDYSTKDMKPAVSGYKIKDNVGQVREQNGFDLSDVNTGNGNKALDMVEGWFHSDYEYDDNLTLNNVNNKYVLDEYNMGFTALKHDNGSYEIEKVYVCTDEYPYTIHTLYGDKIDEEAAAPSTGQTWEINVTTISQFYRFQGQDRSKNHKFQDNTERPEINLNLGDTIKFIWINWNGSHPLYIKHTKSNNANNNNQVTNPSATNQGTSGPITWTPSSTGTYFYQCSNHQNMWGKIKVN